jgi:hypothetical protein
MNDDDFDNDMGLPDDDLTGGSPETDPGDLGLGMDADDDLESAAPSRPSGGARARTTSASRPAKAAPPAAKSAPAKSAAKKKSAKKKAAGKAARKSSRKSAKKSARKVRKASKPARGRKKGGRRR